MIHQPGSFTTVIEVEGEAITPVYTSLQDISPNIFIYPLAKGVMHLQNPLSNNTVIKSFISRALVGKDNLSKVIEYLG